jgi:tagatose-1,6-bisphosphate aldolase
MISITDSMTTAERRALQQITTADGRFAVIAADHGQPLVDMLDALGVSSAPEEQLAFKAISSTRSGATRARCCSTLTSRCPPSSTAA